MLFIRRVGPAACEECESLQSHLQNFRFLRCLNFIRMCDWLNLMKLFLPKEKKEQQLCRNANVIITHNVGKET